MYGTSDERYVQRLTSVLHVDLTRTVATVQVDTQATPSSRGECQMQARVNEEDTVIVVMNDARALKPRPGGGSTRST